METLRLIGPLGLAFASALAAAQLTRARGLEPPGFAEPWRRVAASLFLVLTLYLTVFFGLSQAGLDVEVDFEAVRLPDLFTLHAILLMGLAAWMVLGFGRGGGAGRFGAVVVRQLGLRARRPLREIGIGLATGLLTWPLLLVGVGAAALLAVAFGIERILPTEPPPLVVWVVSLPVPAKLAIALSAGVVEELFFRGFLQPRVGIALSSLLFVLAHLSYDEPFMLVGITLLSLFFAALVIWRQNIWAAITAHFLFDAVQLLVVIPWAVDQL